MPMQQRQAIAQAWGCLTQDDIHALEQGALPLEQADLMIENVIGSYRLPFALATNFRINGQDRLIPMVIEEPSVVAACSNAAKQFRAAGGFRSGSDEPVMIGQLQVLDMPALAVAARSLLARKSELLAAANAAAGSIVDRGGGARELELRHFPATEHGDMLVLHLHFDCRDAMGANLLNSVLEQLSPLVERISGGRVNLRILSNLSDKRKAWASGTVPLQELRSNGRDGSALCQAIVEAAHFAEIDPYRAATHNKGIMNGIDALLLATGNDWRAVEAGAHAYAARDGRYRSLTQWWQGADGNLHGRIELPLSLGTVGGATKVHRGAQIALKLLRLQSARELAEVAAAVGLAQNFAALRALASDGIQQGHMRLHARQLALAAGAPAADVPHIAQLLIAEGEIRLARAQEIVKERQIEA